MHTMATDLDTDITPEDADTAREHHILQKLFMEQESLKNMIDVKATEKAALEARLEEVSALYEAQKLKVEGL